MSVLAVGLSHRTADLAVLERVSVPADDVPKVLGELLRCASVSEAMVVSTCNRVEVYAVVDAFHSALAEIVSVLARNCGHESISAATLSRHLYVHYAAAAVDHLFTVTAGLDSMVVGEAQILGQVRAAYNAASGAGTVGRTLHELTQQALHVGKRVHTETGLDRAGASVVSEALADAERVLGTLAGTRAVVVGAGSMGALAVAALQRAGVGALTVVNRTEERADALAASLAEQGLAARAVPLALLPDALADADVLVTCTGAVGTVVDATTVAARAGTPLVVCDLGLPRDVAPEVAALAGVTVIGLDTLRQRLADSRAGLETRHAARIVAAELAGYLAGQRAAEVTPTVTALRRRAAEVVSAELLRLDSRLPDLDDAVRAELTRTVRRVVDKLLHTPTVRVKELASGPDGAGYAQALRELFELDPESPAAVVRPSRVDGEL